MMSRRAAAMRRERASVERCGIRGSLELGGRESVVGGCRVGARAVSVETGCRKVVRSSGMDFVRW